MDWDDPQLEVEAPVRRAMISLVTRGLALVALVLGVILMPSVPAFRGAADLAAFAAPLLLVAYAVLVWLERRIHGRPTEEARARAWLRAREIDDGDAMLALVFAGWVPVALLAALVVLAWPHLNDPSIEVRGAWGAIGVPALATAWILASNTWIEACRDELARAIGESERRFRSYWANVGR